MIWYVLRDLKRTNAREPGYQYLGNAGFEVFTPLHWVVTGHGAAVRRKLRPVVQDLLFAHAERDALDRVIESVPTLQYRFLRGAYCKPMTVGDAEMRNFMLAVSSGTEPVFYTPAELDALSVGRRVMIIGGMMDGMEGRILKVRGARRKRVMVEIPTLIAAVVEVENDFVKFID